MLDWELMESVGPPKGLGNPLLPETGFEFFHMVASGDVESWGFSVEVLEFGLFGEVLPEPGRGGICFGGERRIVGFNMDFTKGATADYVKQPLAS